MKKKILYMLMLSVCLIAFFTIHVGANQKVSEWAKDTIVTANAAGLLRQQPAFVDFTEQMHREDIAYLLVKAYENYTEEEYMPRHKYPFEESYSAAVHKAFELGLMQGVSETSFDQYKLVTREQMAKVLLTYKAIVSGEPIDLPAYSTADFVDFDTVSDWAKPYVAKAAAEGIIAGYTDGRFAGGDAVTYEMALALVIRSAELNKKTVPTIDSLVWDGIMSSTCEEIYVSCDGEVEIWASDALETISSSRIGEANGAGAVKISPMREKNAYYIFAKANGVFSAPVRVFVDEYQIYCKPVAYPIDGTYKLEWVPVPGVSDYTITVAETRCSGQFDAYAPKPKVYHIPWATDHINLELVMNRRYEIEIKGDDYRATKEVNCTSKWWDAEAEEIYNTYPETKSDAQKLQVQVTVPVWKLKKNGEKYSSTASFQVHYKIAERVQLVFQEIYNGPEKFPIKDVGAYNWRGGRTEHNGGTAIDINANENYCIYNNGTTIGSYWKPFEDPYSITPYGDVVNAFEKYGFTWGADAWGNPKDYMHFSYLGT